MVSIIAFPCIKFRNFHQPISYLDAPSYFPIVAVINSPKLDHPLRSKRKQLKLKKQNQILFEFSDFCRVVRMCKNWEGDSDPALELEVLEFMKTSKKPKRFPSKKELIDAGKSDLVEAIMKRGGWMAVGWADEDEREICEEISEEKSGQNGFECEEISGSDHNEERHVDGISTFLSNSSSAASSSGQSLEMAAKDEGGIAGILHRLERQRKLSFGFKLGKNGIAMDYVNGEFDDNDQNKGIRKDVDSFHLQRSEPASSNHDRPLISGNGLKNLQTNGFSSSLKSDSWRTWSIQRAGFSDTEFEAGEIDFGKNSKQNTVDMSMGESIAVTTEVRGAPDSTEKLKTYYWEVTRGDLKTRLQHLEVELSSALHSLRANANDLSGKTKEHLFEDLRQISDLSEFQENEMMNAQDKLRTLRAKLAVLEGKMSLAIMDAQFILDEKQKRINDALRALQLLRTTCIVWPNYGSEVLLAGSFDGWATQRKMVRSNTGVFSVCLKLYPGKYEIKFIVDGVWKVDPLRPIVNNNGFENNLLTIT
ncbi:Protein PTST-like protein 2 chloroplastic [Bienertia sinuspersici]